MIGSGWFYNRFSSLRDRDTNTGGVISNIFPYATEWARRVSGLRTTEEARSLETRKKAARDAALPTPSQYDAYGRKLHMTGAQETDRVNAVRTMLRERANQINHTLTPIRPTMQADLVLASSPVIPTAEAGLVELQAQDDIVDSPNRMKGLAILGVITFAAAMIFKRV